MILKTVEEIPSGNNKWNIKDFILHGYNHIIDQGCQCVEEGTGGCMYRGDSDGQACFIGACIPDDIYDSNIEVKDFWEIIDCSKKIKDIFEDIPIQLAASLQHCHDLSKIFKCKEEEIKFENTKKDKESFIEIFKSNVKQVLETFNIKGCGPEILPL